MRKVYSILQVFVFLLIASAGYSQTYTQVWSDEFNGSIGPDWTFETGGGGWGNAELEYYQRANATIANNNLVITAKRESVGGMSYTSTRMNTSGHRSWTFGKVEASIKVPSVQGLWPAFWMLGTNIGSVGWPACGETDIMEQINTSTTNYGTIHWNSGGAVSYGGSVNTTGGVYHNYSIIWNNSSITWYVDGNQYVQANIANGINNTGCFQNSFFIILNLAVGGNWPGFTIGTLPASMYVDYVRVSQVTGGGGGGTGSAPIGSYITLKGNNNLFVSSENGTVAMNCNRATAQAWEKFLVVDAGGGLIALQSGSNGQYVTGSSPMWCNATSVGAAQKFSWVIPATGQVQLKCSSNNLFVSSENGTTAMNCNRAVAQAWETFTWAISSKSASVSSDADDESSVRIYPSLVTNNLTVDNRLVGVTQVRVYDLSGKIVAQKALQYGCEPLDLSALSKGMYIVKIENGSYAKTARIVKQ